MSSIFQGFQNPDGRTRVRVVGVNPPAGTIPFRGLMVDPVLEAFLVRSFTIATMVRINGIAVYRDTGIMPYGRTVQPFSIVPGGLQVDSLGVFQYLVGVPDYIHQGVGLDKDGKLAITVVS